jgi:hypothetical protein
MTPAPTYRRTMLDRDPDAVDRLRAVVWGILGGVVTTGLLLGAALIEPGRPGALWRALGGGVVAGIAMTAAVRAASRGGGAAFLAFVQPSGKSCPSLPEHSRIDALAARGDIADALAAYEAAMTAAPDDAPLRVRAAALHARAGDAPRAAALLREVQRLPGRTADDDLAASNRLVDLYLGPLDDRGRALRELRRLADRYPGTVAGRGARDAIARLKANG